MTVISMAQQNSAKPKPLFQQVHSRGQILDVCNSNTVVPGITGGLRRGIQLRPQPKKEAIFPKEKKNVTVFIDQKSLYILFLVTDISLHMISLHKDIMYYSLYLNESRILSFITQTNAMF